MCYLGKGRWGLAYFLLSVLVYCLLPVTAHFGLLPITVDPAFGLVTLAIGLVGAAHCYRIAVRSSPFVPPARFARWYVLLLLSAGPVALALALRTFIWEPYNIPSVSMEPSLRLGDHFMVSKYAYRDGEPQRGDVVVFLLPSDNTTSYVKRLVGLPGERIQMKAGSLYINGEPVPQEEVEQPSGEHGELYRETLPNGRSYLIQDLGEGLHLDDTEVFEVPAGHYFFLGDNRDNSIDSRVAGMMGYVPRENLIGPLVLIYWNSETQRLRLFDEE
jgi:signal peptidase I